MGFEDRGTKFYNDGGINHPKRRADRRGPDATGGRDAHDVPPGGVGGQKGGGKSPPTPGAFGRTEGPTGAERRQSPGQRAGGGTGAKRVKRGRWPTGRGPGAKADRGGEGRRFTSLGPPPRATTTGRWRRPGARRGRCSARAPHLQRREGGGEESRGLRQRRAGPTGPGTRKMG